VSNWKNHNEYWEYLEPRLAIHLANSVDSEVVAALMECLKHFSFCTEGLKAKIKANKLIAPKLDLFLVFGLDHLRCANLLYKNLNLAPAAISARATLENWVNLRFIVKDKRPKHFADLYFRYQEIFKLMSLKKSPFLDPLSSEDEKKVLSENPEWVDNETGRLFKQTHWTAKKGMTFMTMLSNLKMEKYYSLYKTCSQFTHASSITINLYNSPNGFGAIAQEIQSRRMCLLIAIFAMETLTDYCNFFKVDYGYQEHHLIIERLNKLSK
jgi:hypothetical protein